MRRQSPWRSIAFAAALMVAGIWAVGSGWQVSETWPVRDALSRVDLAREEIACGNRSASPANQQRCRDLAEIMNHAERAEAYFMDGLVVLGPSLLLLIAAFWIRRGQGGGNGGRQNGHHDGRHHHHRRPSAA